MIKHLALSLALIATFPHLRAQDDPKGRAVMDRMIAKAKTYTSYDADFSSQLVNKASKLDVKQDGNVKVKGSRFILTLTDNTVINDGKAVWTYNSKSNEVSITDPADMDKEMDPSKIFTIYESGFKSEFVDEKNEGGTTLQTIKLYPLDPAKKPYHTVLITIEKNKSEPRTVKVLYKNGNEVTYTLKKFTPGVLLADSTFSFDKSKYPGVEVNDMR